MRPIQRSRTASPSAPVGISGRSATCTAAACSTSPSVAHPCQCAIIEYGTGQGWEARTDAWQLWQEMAHESEEAARLVEAGGCLRSRASRYYYTLINR